MTHKDKMPAVTKLLEETDSDPMAHIIVAALPGVIATAIQAWKATELSDAGLESRIQFSMNAAAQKVIEFVESQSVT